MPRTMALTREAARVKQTAARHAATRGIIRAALARNGMTQGELAARLGISGAAMSVKLRKNSMTLEDIVAIFATLPMSAEERDIITGIKIVGG